MLVSLQKSRGREGKAEGRGTLLVGMWSFELAAVASLPSNQPPLLRGRRPFLKTHSLNFYAAGSGTRKSEPVYGEKMCTVSLRELGYEFISTCVGRGHGTCQMVGDIGFKK